MLTLALGLIAFVGLLGWIVCAFKAADRKDRLAEAWKAYRDSQDEVRALRESDTVRLPAWQEFLPAAAPVTTDQFLTQVERYANGENP